MATINDKNDKVIIDEFRGEFEFLSNMYKIDLPYKDGWVAKSAEHIFQAEKAISYNDWKYVISASHPKLAKARGRYIECRSDWDVEKIDIMRKVLYHKFTSDYDLRNMLKATGDAILIEGNCWCDTYWGVCNCRKCQGKGENHLGRILMEVRDRLFEEDGECMFVE